MKDSLHSSDACSHKCARRHRIYEEIAQLCIWTSCLQHERCMKPLIPDTIQINKICSNRWCRYRRCMRAFDIGTVDAADSVNIEYAHAVNERRRHHKPHSLCFSFSLELVRSRNWNVAALETCWDQVRLSPHTICSNLINYLQTLAKHCAYFHEFRSDRR